MTSRKKKSFSYVPTLVGAAVTIVLVVGAIALIRKSISGAVQAPKQVVQQIQLIRPPPPPPDVPPPPPPEEEKVEISEPEQQPDPSPSNEPPPGEQLGLDTDGGAGGDAFGLLGRKGGRELTAAGGSAFAWYAGLIKNEILSKLGDDAKIRRGAYSVVVNVWVRDDGTVDRVRLAQSSGDRERDRDIESALSRVSRLSQGPPADMPQPISLRIVSRA